MDEEKTFFYKITRKTPDQEWSDFDVEFHSARISGYLRLAIERRGLTYEKVQELSGVNPESMGKLMSGDPQTSLDTIIRILLALRMSKSLGKLLDPSDDEVGCFYAERSKEPPDFDF
jgi:transcriptional regulator with XRE-family HTH domain